MVKVGSARLRSHSGDDPLFDEEFLHKLEYLHIVSRKIFAGTTRGERRSRKLGQGLEFSDHREYTLGDDLRYLDWNAFGRLERLLLRVFEEEEELWIYLLLDVSGSMAFGALESSSRKFDCARRVAAALGYLGLSNLDRVSVVAFGEGLGARLEPSRGKGQIFKLLDFLRGLRPQGGTSVAASIQTFVHRFKRRGLAVVISDLYDPAGYEEGFDLLRYHRFEPYLIHVVDPAEATPSLKGDVEIVDAETGEQRRVTVTPAVLRRFAKIYAAYLGRAEEFARRRAVPYFRASTELPFEDLILRIFRAGGFVKA